MKSFFIYRINVRPCTDKIIKKNNFKNTYKNKQIYYLENKQEKILLPLKLKTNERGEARAKYALKAGLRR
jgi:murein L,D-transpeptidase YafK